MKKLLILISLICLTGCYPEDDNRTTYYNYIRFTNNSSNNLKIIMDDTESSVIYYDTEVTSNTSTEYIEQILYSDSFYGIHGNENRIKIIFTDTNKGYICGDNPDSSGYCFTTKGSPLRTENINDFIFDKQEGTSRYYTFEITQEDYENAHELP